MKKVINVMKKAAKWYFEQSSKSYTWLVSGTIPPPYRGKDTTKR